jgi:hypothetical protein
MAVPGQVVQAGNLTPAGGSTTTLYTVPSGYNLLLSYLSMTIAPALTADLLNMKGDSTTLLHLGPGPNLQAAAPFAKFIVIATNITLQHTGAADAPTIYWSLMGILQ